MTPNPSLQKKSAARLAAVQLLYRCALNKEPLDSARLVAQWKEDLANNKSEQKLRGGAALEPNYPLLASILEGISRERTELEFRVNSVLTGGWSRERTGALLIAILECATYELFFGKEITPKIILSEYAHITRQFYGEAEVDFVFGALSSLTQRYE